MPKRTKQKPFDYGFKAGTKQSDRRWIDERGVLWASRFECKVYEAALRASIPIRKCDKGGDDTFSYHSEVRNGRCESCQGVDVIQERQYTPDLRVLSAPAGTEGAQPGSGEGEYYVEAKGYLRADKRTLLRCLVKTGKVPDLRFILQSDYRVGKSTLSGWIDKFLHCKWAVFDGEWPREWRQNEARVTRKAVRKVSKDL